MKIPTICENETDCYTNCGYFQYPLIARMNLQNTNFQNDAYCGYWQYQQIAIKKLQNFTLQSCLQWVLNLWQQKRNTKWSTHFSTNVSHCLKVRFPNEVVSAQLYHGDFFHYLNPKNKDGLTPLHMAAINIQPLKYVHIVLQIRIQK